jgi:putative PIN family toxin of toxin-antitoxin system
LIVPDGPPGRVLAAIRSGEVEPLVSWELVEELVDVLRRPALARYEITERDIADVLVLLAPALPTVELDVPIRDPDDAPVVEAALAGAAEAIVTGDGDLLDDADLRGWLSERGIAILTPAELLDRLG